MLEPVVGEFARVGEGGGDLLTIGVDHDFACFFRVESLLLLVKAGCMPFLVQFDADLFQSVRKDSDCC